jgi:hypothetical protein
LLGQAIDVDTYDDSTYNALAGISLGLVFILALIPLIIWIVTLVSIVRSPRWTPAFKALWALAALPTGIVGMICWFVWGAKEGNRPLPPAPSAGPYPQV